MVGLVSDFFLQMFFFTTVLSIDIRRMEVRKGQEHGGLPSVFFLCCCGRIKGSTACDFHSLNRTGRAVKVPGQYLLGYTYAGIGDRMLEGARHPQVYKHADLG